MRLLITNDDGWNAEGIRRLASVASEFGDVTIVAPASAQSGVGHQLTLDRSMELIERGPNVYSLDGTPADCIRFAVSHFSQGFGWVLSGINHGANLGVDIYTSGTVAAAREATFHGTSAIAISQYRSNMADKNFDWTQSTAWCEQLLSTLLSTKTTYRQLVNINLPDVSGLEMPDVVTCPCDRNPLPTRYSESNGAVAFAGRYQDRRRTQGSDVDVCFGGRIAITRLSHLD